MADDNIGEGRPIRTCLACGGRDDHPKCQMVLPDQSSVFYHHDCHAIADPPCAACVWITQHKGDLRGREWRDQVMAMHEDLAANEPEILEMPPAERPVISAFEGGSS